MFPQNYQEKEASMRQEVHIDLLLTAQMNSYCYNAHMYGWLGREAAGLLGGRK